jgi:alcohol dehydrogenase (cytochrome c)
VTVTAMLFEDNLRVVPRVAASRSVTGAQTGVTSHDIQAGFADVTKWLSVAGDYTGRRHSPLNEITPANAARLAPVWTFQTGGVQGQFEATPIVLDGVLYYTGPQNHAWAIDARTGKQIWHYQRTLVAGLKVCCGPVNRGFAVLGDRLSRPRSMPSSLALDMKTGKVVWDVEIADYKLATPARWSARCQGRLSSHSGGEYANRAFDARLSATGRRACSDDS